MGYPICYLIAESGKIFNQILDPCCQVAPDYFAIHENSKLLDLRDIRLVNHSLEFTGDLTGRWTLCTLPYNFSLLSRSPEDERVTLVYSWEKALRRKIPESLIIRVDDFIFDPWQCKFDYLLIRNLSAIQEFVLWLLAQDDRSWRILPQLHDSYFAK